MFFENPKDIPTIAQKSGTSIFVIPKDLTVDIKNAIILQPETKSVITIEQVRQLLQKLTTKQKSDRFIVIRPAELLNEEAANALLKSLEEPKAKIHFLLITDAPSQILPTILSRAHIYFLHQPWSLNAPLKAEEKDKNLAKKLLAAKPSELVALAEEITKKKDRNYALNILELAIEMLYRTYLINGKEVFLTKLPKFLTAYKNISRNGHVKLHLVADLC